MQSNVSWRCAVICAGIVLMTVAAGSAQTLAPGVSLVPVAPGYARYDLNAASFNRHSLVSIGSTQYIAFYSPATNVVVGRRTLGTTSWETNETSFKPYNATDGHDIISIGIGSDGILHCAWGMHGETVPHYARGTQAWSLNLVATNMTGLENTVTYPQFIHCPNGDVLYLFREGTSGAGDTYLNRWSSTTHTWTNVNYSGGQKPFIKGTTGSSATDCNAYPNFTCFDSQTNLHVTWVWRENAASIDYNHDHCYAGSPDYGVTWRKWNGATYSLPITKSTADIIVPIPQNSSLMNQCGQCIDTNDRPVIATWWAPGGSGTAIQVFIIWNDGSQWRTNQVGTRTTTVWPKRPIIICDTSNRLFMVFTDNERGSTPTLAWTSDPNRAAWSFADLTSDNMGSWEPAYDPEVWQRDGKLHVLYQQINGAASSPVSVLEFDPAIFLANLPSPGVTYEWPGTSGSGVWSTASNWTNNAAPPAGGSNNLTLSFKGSSDYTANNDLAGVFRLNSLQFNSTAPGTNVLNGNTLAFVANGTVAPTLKQLNSALFYIFNPVVLSNQVNVTLGGSGYVLLAGEASGPGGLNISGSGALALYVPNSFAGGISQSSGWLVVLSADAFGATPATFVSNRIALGGTATLAIVGSTALNDTNTGVTISGTPTNYVDSGVEFTIANRISGAGTLTKAGEGTLVLSGSNSFSGILALDRGLNGNYNDGITRLATAEAVANVTEIRSRNTSVDDAAATLELAPDSGSMVLPQTLSFSCRRSTISPTVHNLAGTNTLSGMTYIYTGGNTVNYQAEPATRLEISGDIQYVGDLVAGRNLYFTGGGDVLVTGDILFSQNGITPVSVVKDGTGTLTLAGNNTYSGVTTVNDGLLQVTGSITSTGLVTVAGGTLAGTGTINAPLTVAPSGTLSPGSSIGELTVNNTVALSGTTLMEITHTGPTNDVLVVSGTLNRGGTLIVTNIGPELLAGDSFKLFEAGTMNGSFGSMTLPALQTGLRWNTNQFASASILAVEAILSPQIAVTLLGGTNLMLGFDTQLGVNYVLQSATNLQPTVVWANVKTNLGNGSPQSFQVPVSPQPQEFFRAMAY